MTKEQEREELHRTICQISNDYNISISSNVEQENSTEEVDIEKLNAHNAEIVIRQNKHRTAIDAIVADLEGGTL